MQISSKILDFAILNIRTFVATFSLNFYVVEFCGCPKECGVIVNNINTAKVTITVPSMFTMFLLIYLLM